MINFGDDSFVFTVDDVIQSVGFTELFMAVTESLEKDLREADFVFPFEIYRKVMGGKE